MPGFEPPPGGWRPANIRFLREGEWEITLSPSDSAGRITLHVSLKSLNRPAHLQTKSFNVLVAEHANISSITTLRTVLRHYFRLFEANDPAGPGRDGRQPNFGNDREEPPQFPQHEEAMLPPAGLDTLVVPEPDNAHVRLLMSSCFDGLEKAMYVSDPCDLKHFVSDIFGRLYFGNEYCERLLPSRRQLEWVAAFSAENNIGLTFTTPFCLDSSFPAVEDLLDRLPAGTEVVFNDWGLLNSIVQRDLRPVHGRLLCSIRKDPRIVADDRGRYYHRSHNIQSFYQAFLIENNVSRVELDNAPQGWELMLDPLLSASIYFPFVTCSITRKCSFANAAAGSVKYKVIDHCAGQCAGRVLSLDLDGKNVLVKGNAHFFVNSEIPALLQQWNVTRIVYMPVIPNHNRFAEPPNSV